MSVGLDLTVQHRSVLSNEPFTDPDGSRLTALFDQAEEYYEDLIEDSHQLEVQFYYFDFGTQTQNLGSTRLISQSSGRATKVYIQIAKNPVGSPNNWYYDASPNDHSEFNLQRTLAQDLSSSQRTDYFNGSVPDTLELGYAGHGSGNAAGKYDLYTLVLHELGHALGLHSENTSTINETYDGDYDFTASQLGGYNGAAEIESGQVSHLEAPTTLMAPMFSPGQRRLPSASDLLAMSATHNYSQLDLHRVDFAADGGSNTWTSSNWIGGRSPDSGDDAYIGSADHNPTVLLVSNAAVNNLSLSRGDNLDLSNRRLTVSDTLKLRDNGTDVLVRGGSGAVLEAGRIDAGASVQIDLRDGGKIEAYTMDLSVGASLFTGAGQLSVQDRLNNHGEIRGLYGGNTVFATNGTHAAWDLDGDGNGTVNVAAADLTFTNGRFTDDFGGTLLVREGRTLTVPETLTIDGGFTEFSGANYQDGPPARLSGGDLRLNDGTMRWQGNVRVDGDFTMIGGSLSSAAGQEHRTEIAGNASFLGGTINTDSQHYIRAGGDLVIDGVSITGDTRFESDGDVFIRGNVQLGSVLSEQTLRVEGNLSASVGVSAGAGGALILANGAVLFAETFDVDAIEIGDTIGSASLTWGHVLPGVATAISFDIEGTATHQHDRLLDYSGQSGNGRDATLVLRTGYTPEQGDQVTLIEGDFGLDAQPFSQIEGVETGQGLRWALSYDADAVRATAALPGDTDLDHDVDFRDAMTLLRGYHASEDQALAALAEGTDPALGWRDGDFDHDMDVDLDDALALAGNYLGINSLSLSGVASDVVTVDLLVDIHSGTAALSDTQGTVAAVRLHSPSGNIRGGLQSENVFALRDDAQMFEAIRLEAGVWSVGVVDATGTRDLRFWFAGYDDAELMPGVVRYVPEPASSGAFCMFSILSRCWLRRRFD